MLHEEDFTLLLLNGLSFDCSVFKIKELLLIFIGEGLILLKLLATFVEFFSDCSV